MKHNKQITNIAANAKINVIANSNMDIITEIAWILFCIKANYFRLELNYKQ